MIFDLKFFENVAIWTVAWSLLIWFVIVFYGSWLKPMFANLFHGKKVAECKIIIESTPDDDERIRKLSVYDLEVVKIAYLKAKKIEGVKKDEQVSTEAKPIIKSDVGTGTGTDDRARNRKPAKQWPVQTKTFGNNRKVEQHNEGTEPDHD